MVPIGYPKINHEASDIVPTKRKPIRLKPKVRSDKHLDAFLRIADLGELLLAGTSPKKPIARRKVLSEVRAAREVLYDHMFVRIQRCINIAIEKGSWEFMKGRYSQAVDIYAVASLAYEQYDSPIMSDGMFDKLAKLLYTDYNKITDFCKEEWGLSRGIFSAGSGAHFRNPQGFKSQVLLEYNNRLLQHYEKGKASNGRASNEAGLLRQTPDRGKPSGTTRVRKPPRRVSRKA